MTMAADQFDDTPSPTDQQQFVDLANNRVDLLPTANREFERDHEAAKARWPRRHQRLAKRRRRENVRLRTST